MIRTILSSGQTGVELAALDTAIKLGIAHGGWTCRGRRNEDGPLSVRYQLEETESIGTQPALEKNVSASDGTLLVSRQMGTHRTRQAVQATLKYQRQFLHVDLGQYAPFEAASLIASWMAQQQIKVVFITGPLASEDERIYQQTCKILETAFYLGFIKTSLHPEHTGMYPTASETNTAPAPRSVAEAVQRLQSILPLKDRILMANMQPTELDRLQSGLGEFIKSHFGLYTGNSPLLQSCAEAGGMIQPLANEACAVILRALWEELRKTHKLRVIK